MRDRNELTEEMIEAGFKVLEANAGPDGPRAGGRWVVAEIWDAMDAKRKEVVPPAPETRGDDNAQPGPSQPVGRADDVSPPGKNRRPVPRWTAEQALKVAADTALDMITDGAGALAVYSTIRAIRPPGERGDTK